MLTVIGLSGGLYGHVFAYNNMRVIIFTWKSHAREVECTFLVFAHTGLFAVVYLFSALATASVISASSERGERCYGGRYCKHLSLHIINKVPLA